MNILRTLGFVGLTITAFLMLGACDKSPKKSPPPKRNTKMPKPAPKKKTPWKTPSSAIAPVWYAGDATPWKTAEGVQTACDRVAKRVGDLHKALVAVKGARTPANTLVTLNEIDVALDTGLGWSSFIAAVHPEEPVRKKARECKKALSKLQTNISLDPRAYKALAAVPTDGLDAQAKRFVKKALRGFRRSGVDKDEKTRKELKAINERMVAIQQAFGKNVREDTRSISVKSAKDLKGLPADYIKAHPKNKKGEIVITTNYPDFFPFQTYSVREDLRLKLYEAFMSRAYPKNKALLLELLTLRYRYAKLLGYESWAAYTAEDKMVKTAATIKTFVGDLAKLARPRMKSDLKVLLAAKKKDDPKATRIQVADRFFYVNKVRKDSYGFDAQKAREYFPYAAVKKGILEVFAELFDIKFVKLDKEPVWHPDVEAYAVMAKGKRLGKVYLDMHPREGKYKHAAVFPMQTGLKGRLEPVCSLVCNFPKPGKDNPGLMEHTSVVTFFHEFGHAIHHLLGSNADWASLSGFNVEWDFVEAPSQILEEWAWDPKVLARFAKHVKTGKPIPAELVKKMKAASEFGKGVHVMRQIFYTAYSFFLHDRDPKDLDLDAFTNTIQKDYSPYPRLKGGHVYANFGHLMGYSSMYYTYQWSLVIAKDLFTRFQKEGLLNQKTAKAYRELILGPGGTHDAADLVKKFLGRAYKLDAYKRWLTDP